jgi:hypothetical protein
MKCTEWGTRSGGSNSTAPSFTLFTSPLILSAMPYRNVKNLLQQLTQIAGLTHKRCVPYHQINNTPICGLHKYILAVAIIGEWYSMKNEGLNIYRIYQMGTYEGENKQYVIKYQNSKYLTYGYRRLFLTDYSNKSHFHHYKKTFDITFSDLRQELCWHMEVQPERFWKQMKRVQKHRKRKSWELQGTHYY